MNKKEKVMRQGFTKQKKSKKCTKYILLHCIKNEKKNTGKYSYKKKKNFEKKTKQNFI